MHSLLGTDQLGLYEWSDAHADSCSRKCFCYWDWQLAGTSLFSPRYSILPWRCLYISAGLYFLGSDFALWTEKTHMEVLLYLCWYVFNIEFYLFSLLRNQDLLYMSPTILSLNFLLLLGGRLIFWLLAWDLVVTIPVVYFFFKETKKVSLEDISYLASGRWALCRMIWRRATWRSPKLPKWRRLSTRPQRGLRLRSADIQLDSERMD
jgi:hypothetical protein